MKRENQIDNQAFAPRSMPVTGTVTAVLGVLSSALAAPHLDYEIVRNFALKNKANPKPVGKLSC